MLINIANAFKRASLLAEGTGWRTLQKKVIWETNDEASKRSSFTENGRCRMEQK